jgi:TrmH family RNA methyltransferase
VKAITSDANPAFRRWLRIAGAPRAARAAGQTLAEGVHLAQAAIGARVPVQGAVLRRGATAAVLEPLLAQLPADVPRWELAPALYDRIAPVEHGVGLLLVLPIPEPVLPRRAAADCVYLDGVQDPGNVGALIRTAAAAGVRHVMASPGTAALWAPKVLRAAMGAHFRIGLHERVLPTQLAGALDGRWIAAVAHEAPSLWEADLAAPAVGWVFGSEGGGASAEALVACASQVCIPTTAAVESLNVAAAAAVCLFERLRRR